MFKKNPLLIFCLIMILSLTGCSLFRRQEIFRFWERKADDQAISRVLITYANELRHELGLRFEDSTLYYKDYVDGIRIIFSTQAIIELKEARELIVDIIEGLLDRINSDPFISSQFENGYASADQIELYVSFESYFNEYVDQEYIGWVSVIDGISRFYAGLIKYPYNDYWHARTELYQKSLQFVIFDREAESAYEAAHPAKQGPGPAYDVLIE